VSGIQYHAVRISARRHHLRRPHARWGFQRTGPLPGAVAEAGRRADVISEDRECLDPQPQDSAAGRTGMIHQLQRAVIPVYLGLCLLLGGASAAGFPENLLLHVMAPSVIGLAPAA